mmetsp:Transcript_61810/g.182480  ORF Transcript_61810/g.182480 Transcript_61810/m.182480 type:complete len:267 (-) Transcript_61810:92-892(-)
MQYSSLSSIWKSIASCSVLGTYRLQSSRYNSRRFSHFCISWPVAKALPEDASQRSFSSFGQYLAKSDSADCATCTLDMLTSFRPGSSLANIRGMQAKSFFSFSAAVSGTEMSNIVTCGILHPRRRGRNFFVRRLGQQRRPVDPEGGVLLSEHSLHASAAYRQQKGHSVALIEKWIVFGAHNGRNAVLVQGWRAADLPTLVGDEGHVSEILPRYIFKQSHPAVPGQVTEEGAVFRLVCTCVCRDVLLPFRIITLSASFAARAALPGC